MQDALAVACDQALVMGGDEHGDADLVEGDEDLEDAGGRFGVEIGGRLVGDQERGPVHHRARDREALLLAPESWIGFERSRPSSPTLSSAARTRRAASFGAWPENASGS